MLDYYEIFFTTFALQRSHFMFKNLHQILKYAASKSKNLAL